MIAIGGCVFGPRRRCSKSVQTASLSNSAEWVVGFVIAVGVAQNLVVLIQLLIATRTWRPLISLIAPAYNESLNIVESTRSLLNIRYPHFEVIVVNDGSKDDTLQKLIDNFDLRCSHRAYDNLTPHKPIRRVYRYYQENNLPYDIVSVAEPVCWTEVPENLTILSRQRKRWQRSALETFFKHRKMLMNPSDGRVGSIGMTFSLLIDVIGPLVEVVGYVVVPLLWFSGMLNPVFALAFLALTFFFGVFVSARSLILEEVTLHPIARAKDLLKMMFIILIENFGYRQFNNIWRVRGWWEFMRKKKRWGEMTRSGLGQSQKPQKPPVS